ncbi:MAG: hypothetical protein ACHP7F_10925 [Actinomycetales bacterium]|jgi:hypothetical protein
MHSWLPETRTSGESAKSKRLGIVALWLAIATAVVALGTLGLAASLYAPIQRATSISAGEGPSLTVAQEHVSSVVVTLKSLALLGSAPLGMATLFVGAPAIFMDRGRGAGVIAFIILAITAVLSVVLLADAFRVDPCLAHITCG